MAHENETGVEIKNVLDLISDTLLYLLIYAQGHWVSSICLEGGMCYVSLHAYTIFGSSKF